MPDIHVMLRIVYTVVIPSAVLLMFILANAMYLQYVERKIWAWMQNRMGPMQAGPHGIFQAIADTVKFLLKEDVIPTKADKPVFVVAPILMLMMAFGAFVALPFGPDATLFGYKFHLWVSNLNIGVIYVLALAGVGTYGVILGGWASNNKYSLMGGFRSAAQMISYEIPMAFAVVAVVLMAGSLNLSEIVNAQTGKWFLFTPVGPVLFFLYGVAGFAETNRTPFDLPEAESELVAGFMTEYSGIRFGFFFMAEYMNMLVVSMLISILFLGGWLPLQIFPHWLGDITSIRWFNSVLAGIPPVLWMLAKMYFFIFVFAWVRATLPRYRYDQLMALSWKFLLPLSLATLMVTAFMKHGGWL